jgi:hypothetical protein
MQFTPAPGSDPLPEAPAPAQEGARAPTQQDLEFAPAPGSLNTNQQPRYIAPPRPPQVQFSTSEVAGDLARSLGSGLVRSVAAIPGIPGSLREAYETVSPSVNRFFNVQTNMPQAEADRVYNERQQALARTRETREREGTSLPTIEDIYGRVSRYIPLVNYEPRTMAGRITQAGSEFLNPLGDITLIPRALAAAPRGIKLIQEGGNVASGMRRGANDLLVQPTVSAGNLSAAAGSVGAGEAFQGTEAEPYARLLGGFSGAAAGPTIGRAVQSLDPERTIANAMRTASPMDPGLTVAQARAALAAGRTPSVVELQGARKPIAGAMARHPETPEGNAIQQQILDNQANANHSFRTAMDAITGGENNVFQARKEARDAAGLSGEYDALYRNPAGNFIWDNELENLFHDDAALAAMRRASVAVSRENNVPHEFPFTQGQNGTWHVSQTGSHDPNIQFWDYTLRELRNSAERPENLGHTQNSLNQLVERLRGKLGSTQEGGLDEFGALLARGSQYYRGNDAFDDGLGFFNLANTRRNQADVEAFDRQMDIFNNKYSEVERSNFRTALANQMIENVDNVSSVFARNDNVFFDRMRQVFGEDQFNQIRNSMDSYNIVKNVQRINPGNSNGGNASFLNSILKGVVGGVAPYVAGVATPMTAATLGAVTTAVDRLTNMAGNVAANRLLRMAASNDPSSVRRIIELANERPEYARALREMSPYLQAITHAATPRESEFVSRGSEPLPRIPETVVTAPRPTRASGGRITSHHRAKAQALINAADRAKKAHNGTTKPILDMPDETVAKALSLADQAI